MQGSTGFKDMFDKIADSEPAFIFDCSHVFDAADTCSILILKEAT